MHEMSLIESVVALVEDERRKQDFSRVRTIRLAVGLLGHAEPEALRFCFDADENTIGLRAGMSANVSIDTGRSRSLGELLISPFVWIESWFVSPSAAETAAP